jgi:hypothetical protein
MRRHIAQPFSGSRDDKLRSASEIKLSALAPQACVRSEQQVKMVTLHSSNLDTPMSPLGSKATVSRVG